MSVASKGKLPELAMPKPCQWDTPNLFLKSLKPILLSKVPFVYPIQKCKKLQDYITIHDAQLLKERQTKPPKHKKRDSKVTFQLPAIEKHQSNHDLCESNHDWICIECQPPIKHKADKIEAKGMPEKTSHLLIDTSDEKVDYLPTKYWEEHQLGSYGYRTPTACQRRSLVHPKLDQLESHYTYPAIIRPYFHGIKTPDGKLKSWRKISRESSLWEDKYVVEKIHKSSKEKEEESLCLAYYANCERIKDRRKNTPAIQVEEQYRYPDRFLPGEERMAPEPSPPQQHDSLDLLLNVAKVRSKAIDDVETLNSAIAVNDTNQNRSNSKKMHDYEKIFREKHFKIIVKLLKQKGKLSSTQVK